jgi:uncharacterized protein with von Willebrand factor type A (vWA) domain
VSVAAQLAGFAGALRAHGVRVGMADELDAAGALTLVDLLDRAEVRRGLRIALKVPRDAWAVFDRLFDEQWGGITAPDVPVPPPADAREHRGARWRWDGARVRLELPEPTPEGGEASYSPEALLRDRPFDELAPGELAAMERLAARLALRLAARKSRRRVPTRAARGDVDLRRSFRHALATAGEPLRLARRVRARDEPRLVLLYDTSGSMDPYARVHLAFAFALRRVIRRTEIFSFNTALARVTALVSPAAVARSLARLGAAVPDWSGGTRIGECLDEFVAVHADRLVGRDTTVVIVSDGLDRGDAARVADAMRALRSRAGTIVWLNPLAGDARYAPAAGGMAAALPYVDRLGPAHDLAALEGLLRIL